MSDFEHEALDAYKSGLEFIAGADKMTKMFAPARAYIGQLLNERATVVLFGIAKGAGEPNPVVKAESLRESRRAAVEAAAVLDVCRVLKLGDEPSLGNLRKALLKIVGLVGEQVRAAEAQVPRPAPPAAVPVPAPPAAPTPPPAAPPTEEFI